MTRLLEDNTRSCGRCTCVLVYSCTVYSCTRVPVYSCTRVLMYSCTCVLVYWCTDGYNQVFINIWQWWNQQGHILGIHSQYNHHQPVVDCRRHQPHTQVGRGRLLLIYYFILSTNLLSDKFRLYIRIFVLFIYLFISIITKSLSLPCKINLLRTFYILMFY